MSSTLIPNSTSSNMPMQIWEYRPTNESPEMLINKQKLQHIRSIARKLSQITLPIDKKTCDYPIIDASALSMVGLGYHNNREIFVLGGHAFFRRYNDNWSGNLMYTKSQHNGYVAMWMPVSSEFLAELDNLLNTKDPQTITFEEISALVKLYN
jgi:hypothetical protein